MRLKIQGALEKKTVFAFLCLSTVGGAGHAMGLWCGGEEDVMVCGGRDCRTACMSSVNGSDTGRRT